MYQIRIKICLKIPYQKFLKIQRTHAVTCLYDEYLETWSTTQGHSYYPLKCFLWRIWRQLVLQSCCCVQSFKTDHFDLNSSQSSVCLSKPSPRSKVIFCWLVLSNFFLLPLIIFSSCQHFGHLVITSISGLSFVLLLCSLMFVCLLQLESNWRTTARWTSGHYLPAKPGFYYLAEVRARNNVLEICIERQPWLICSGFYSQIIWWFIEYS